MATCFRAVAAALHVAPAAAAVAAVVKEQPLAVSGFAEAHGLEFRGGEKIRRRLSYRPKDALERVLGIRPPLPSIAAVRAGQRAVLRGIEGLIVNSAQIGGIWRLVL